MYAARGGGEFWNGSAVRNSEGAVTGEAVVSNESAVAGSSGKLCFLSRLDFQVVSGNSSHEYRIWQRESLPYPGRSRVRRAGPARAGPGLSVGGRHGTDCRGGDWFGGFHL